MVKVFMTLLATKDSDHVSRMDAYRIARKCCLDEVRVLDILKLLASPDTRRKVKQEFDGRRIKAVEDGWLILNGQKYRDMVSEERRKANNRKSQETFRRRQKEQAQSPEFAAARAEEYQKRRKPGKREMAREGAKAGAQQAIRDGFHDANS